MNFRTVVPAEERYKAIQIDYQNMEEVAEWLNAEDDAKINYYADKIMEALNA